MTQPACRYLCDQPCQGLCLKSGYRASQTHRSCVAMRYTEAGLDFQRNRGNWTAIIYVWSICHGVMVCWQQQDSPAKQGQTWTVEQLSCPGCQPQWGGCVCCLFPWGSVNQAVRWRMPMNYSGTCCIWSTWPGNVLLLRTKRGSQRDVAPARRIACLSFSVEHASF